jgi:hypothetical protein
VATEVRLTLKGGYQTILVTSVSGRPPGYAGVAVAV